MIVSKVMNIYENDGLTYMKFKLLENVQGITHGVSTRRGGVSTMPGLESLNLGFSTKDDPENVKENYRRFTKVLGIDVNHLVFAKQTHSSDVMEVDESYWGKGIFRERDYTDKDALVTNRKGVPLVIHTADCVPVSFTHKKALAIGNAHCGWRGTYGELAVKTLDKMVELYGVDTKDILVTIGPCICKSCYEVSKELYEDFQSKFNFIPPAENEKYYLDLGEINKQLLVLRGVPKENIALCDLCTCCSNDILFSHRGIGPQRGLMSLILQIDQGI